MPGSVFPEEMLRPEKQDLADFVAGVDAIVEAQRPVARDYFEDGSVEAACPPIRALLHIMAYGEYEGMRAYDPRIRGMFTRESLLASDWYRERLRHPTDVGHRALDEASGRHRKVCRRRPARAAHRFAGTARGDAPAFEVC